MSKRGTEVEEGNVGYEQEVSEIEKKVLHSDSSDSTWVAQSLDDPSFNSHDTKATTPPRCVKGLQDIHMATAGQATREEEFEESEVVVDSEQLGRKRSFDQIATYGELRSSKSPVKMLLSSTNDPVQPSPEKLPVVIATHDGLSKTISSHLNLVSGQAEKSAEKSDVELSNERPLMNVQQELVAPNISEIYPSEGPIEGGLQFVQVFGQALPPEVKSAWAKFGEKAVADLKRINDFNLKGRIPASDKPGKVTVTVYSSTGRLLGKTDFSYYDRDKGTLLRLVEDPKLQSEFVCHWADFKVKMKRSEGQDLSEPLAGPSCTGYLGDEESLSSKSSGSESSFSEDNSSTTLSKGEHERDVGNLCSTARESRRQNIQQQNPGCNFNFDQNSIAEKTRRAKERSNEEETGDLNGAPLWQKQNGTTI